MGIQDVDNSLVGILQPHEGLRSPLLSNFALIRRFSNFDHFITDFLSHMTHNVMGQSRKTLSPSFPREVQLHWWIVTELIINPPGFLRIPNAQKLRAVKNRTRQIRRRLK
jgi:hypothetical protein